MKKISVVVPVFNEEQVIGEFCKRLLTVLKKISTKYKFEIIFVDDGSKDGTFEVISKIATSMTNQKKISISVVKLSRNWGHQAALLAGLSQTTGDAVISLDADLQDPPEVIPEMISEFEQGAEVVFAQRRFRGKEKIGKSFTAKAYYKVLKYFSDLKIPPNTADYRLMSKRANGILLELKEANPYLRGLAYWIGFKQAIVQYDRDERAAGVSHYSWSMMFTLARNGVVGFSTKPLKFAFNLSALFFTASSTFSVYLIYAKLTHPENSLPGYTSILVVLLWSFAIQTFLLGVLGEYVKFSFIQLQKRPRYIISTITELN
jgi:dolichol-phosphate mannosyltransferase